METIDIHTHGAFGINFDSASADEINEYARLAYQEGIKAFCPTLTGNSTEYLHNRLYEINHAKEKQKENEAKIIGTNLEGTFLSPQKCGVQNPKVFIKPNIENFKKIAQEFENIIKIVVIAPENNDCEEFIKFLNSKEIKVHFGHTNTRQIIGADCINHLYNAMEPISHKHTGAIVKALLDENIYTELIADTIHVNEDILKLTFKIRPNNKIILISDSLPIAKSNLEFVEFCGKKVFKNGLDEKGTLGGSIKLLPEIVENLINKKLLSQDLAHKMSFENPMNYLKVSL